METTSIRLTQQARQDLALIKEMFQEEFDIQIGNAAAIATALRFYVKHTKIRAE